MLQFISIFLNFFFQYFIRSSLQSIRDKHLFFIDITQSFTILISIFSNFSAKNSSSSSIFIGFLFSTLHFTIDHIFSTGFASWLLDGQSNKCNVISLLTCGSRKKTIFKDRNIIWTIKIASKYVTGQYAFHTYHTPDMNFLTIFRWAFTFFIRNFRSTADRITENLE